jgi:integrase
VWSAREVAEEAGRETFITQRLSQNRSGGEIARLLRREVGKPWTGKSIHEISKRDVVEVISAIEQRGAPIAANKTLKSLKTFLRWCVGRAVLDQSPAEGVPLPAKEVARDHVLDDQELAEVILAARKIGGPYGGIVELLALTGQRREEVAGLTWQELDLEQRVWTIPKSRTKNGKAHVVHLSDQSLAVLKRTDQQGPIVFSLLGSKPFQDFSTAKRQLDQLLGVTGWRLHDLRRTCVSGMARLGIAPHVADKILNHQVGTISGPLDLRNFGAVGEKLAVSRKAVSVRGHHRGIGNDHLDTVFGLTDGDILPVFVSAEIRKREPVRDLQGVLVLCRKGDAAQDGEQQHDDHDWRGWISCHDSLLRFCKSKSVASVQAVLRSARCH